MNCESVFEESLHLLGKILGRRTPVTLDQVTLGGFVEFIVVAHHGSCGLQKAVAEIRQLRHHRRRCGRGNVARTYVGNPGGEIMEGSVGENGTEKGKALRCRETVGRCNQGPLGHCIYSFWRGP